MKKQWCGRNIDLTLLSERVETFFINRELKAMKNSSENEYTIVWKSPVFRNLRGTVKIIGDFNDFWIEFTGGETAHRSILLGLVTTLFGGGYLIREGLKVQDALEKLEDEFWAYIESEVEGLSS